MSAIVYYSTSLQILSYPTPLPLPHPRLQGLEGYVNEGVESDVSTTEPLPQAYSFAIAASAAEVVAGEEETVMPVEEATTTTQGAAASLHHTHFLVLLGSVMAVSLLRLFI